MINYKHKFIFVHIPRTGGTSLEKQFNYNGDRDGRKHLSFNQYSKLLNGLSFRDYFKFTFIRNPWDIMISNYLDAGWYSSSKPGRGGQIGYHSRKSLKYFLEHYKPAKHEHGDALLDFFSPEEVDFIGRFENRSNDLQFISSKIGLKLDSSVVQRKNSHKKHYTKYYNQETRDMVANRYSKDINTFGYKFGD
jgi:hypothetical protein